MSYHRAIGNIVASAFLYGCQPILLKWAYACDGNGFSIALYMALFGAAVLAFIMKKKRLHFLPFSRSTFGKLILLAFLGNILTSTLLYYSYSRISASLATTLHYIYPVAITGIMTCFFHEQMTKAKAIALLLSVAGIIMIGDGIDGWGDLIGMLTALASGVSWAFYIVCLDKSGLAKENQWQVNFYLCCLSILPCAIIAWAAGHLKPLDAPIGWMIVAGVSILSRALAAPLFQRGIARVGATASGMLSTLEPITATFLGWLLLGEHLTQFKLMGILLVLGGIIVVSAEKHSAAS